MQSYARVSRWLSILSVLLLNLVQLFQVISFLKHTSKHYNWGKSIDSLVSTSKSLSLRSAHDPFIILYLLSISVIFLSILLYIVFYNFIHKVNKASKANQDPFRFLLFAYFQYFIEYFIFGLGFIPMVSKLIEVQVCDLDLNIDSYSSISCYNGLQMWLVQIGFIGCSVAYFFNAVIIPALKYERQGVERMWSRESYFEGLYYLVLLGSVSFMSWVHKPWIGVMLCGLVFVYGLVYECYETLTVGCSRCATLASLLWVFLSAHLHDSDSNTGRLMLSLVPLAYIAGFAVKLARHNLTSILPARWKTSRC